MNQQAIVKLSEKDNQKKAKKALKDMRQSLTKWLKIRQKMDNFIAENPNDPRAKAAAIGLREKRFADEQDLANTIHVMLTEIGIPASSLPDPNVKKDPQAAVELARIALSGKTPEEMASPEAQGIAWFVLAIPALAAVLIVGQLIKSKADTAMHAEEIRCIESGACTDYGFWLKMGAIVTIGWVAWDKMGLKDKFKKAGR